MTVGQLMTRQVRTCHPEDPLNTAAAIMWEQDCGCVPVVQQGDQEQPRLVGMLTDRDICMAAYTQGRPLTAIQATSVMQRDLATCVATDPIGVALNIFRTRRLRRLPVVQGDGELVGLLSLADVAREAKREESHVERPAIITAAVVGSTVAVISEPRGTDREVVVATS
jgi:CBS domain-containing protein